MRLLATLAAGILAAFASAAPRQIMVWNLSIGPDSKGLEAAVREFERRNPEYRVRLLTVGGRMDPQKLMTAIAGDTAPDVIHQDRFTIADWASRGAFQALDPFIERDKDIDPLCPRPEQYYPAPWKEASFGGKVYAIPSSADNRILYWNRTMFRAKAAELRAAGLDPERAPRTWSELKAYSKVLTEFDKDGSLVKVGFMPNFGNSWLYLYSFQNNGTFLSPDGRRCTMATPENAEALQFMVDGYDAVGGYENGRKFESGFLTKENDPFVIGKVAMKIDGDWILSDLARYGPNVDVMTAPAPVPDDRFARRGRFASEQETYVTWFGGFSYAIPRGNRDPEAGWKFIKWIASAEGQLLWAKAQQKWDAMRGRVYVAPMVGNRVANELIAKETRPADPKFAAAIDTHLEMARHGRVRPATFVGQTLWSQHVQAMEEALYHKSSPMEALKAHQEVVQAEIDTYYANSQYPVINPAPFPYLAGALLLGIAVLAWWGIRRARLGRVASQEAKWAYVFLSPWIIGFLLLTLGPMLASLIISFASYDVLNEARWVGAKNYTDMFGTDAPNLSKALFNAAYLAGIGVPLSVFTGLGVALLLNSAARGMRFYRTIFYMPAIVPGVASAILWTWVLSADANKGLVNSAWTKTITAWMHLPAPGWLQSADWSKDGLILMGVWGAGSGMILWLAGLKGVPTSLYEAARVDGAAPRQQFWSVTWPQLTPIIFFNVVMGFIGAVQEFDRTYIMRPSLDGPIGPDNSMLTPVYHLFQNGFAYFKMGYASALAWMLFALIVTLTFLQFWIGRKWVHYEVERK